MGKMQIPDTTSCLVRRVDQLATNPPLVFLVFDLVF